MNEPGAPAASPPTDAANPEVGEPAVLPSAGAAMDAVALALRAQYGPADAAEPGAGAAATTVAPPREDPFDVLFAEDPATSSRKAKRAAKAEKAGKGVPAPKAAPEPKARKDGRRRPSTFATRFWRYGFPVLTVGFVFAIVLLGWAGKKVVLQSTDGRLVTDVTDPAAPGWTGITDPTPTLLLVQTDAAGTPNGLTVLTLTGDDAGGVVFVPMTTVLDLADIGQIPLNTAATKGGMPALQKAVEGVLGVGMAETVVVSPDQWADLVAPVGPITFTNPDDVTVAAPDGTKRLLFPKGEISLEAKDVALFLASSSPNENDLNRLVRQQRFWDAWLHKVGTTDRADAVPGERESGVGRFVRALAQSRVEMGPLPVKGAGIPGSTSTLYVPIADQVQALVARIVPYPLGAPPGARPRVKLLDGTGTLDHGLPAAPLLVAGGGQIDLIGNAPAFDAATTQLVYYDDARKAEVEKLRDALGVGEVVKGTAAGSAVDVTITLGRDYADRTPPTLAAPATGEATSPTTAPASTTSGAPGG